MIEGIKGMSMEIPYQILPIIVIDICGCLRSTSCRRNFGRDIGAWENDRKRGRKLADEMLPIVTSFILNILTLIIIQKYF